MRQNGRGQGRLCPSHRFLIAIEPGDDRTAWGVIAPDLPGCFAAGDTLQQALDNAVEAIAGFVQHVIDGRADLPETQPFASHQHSPDFQGLHWARIEVPLPWALAQ